MALSEEIRDTLRDYLDAVPRQREPNPPDLLALFAKLDSLHERLAQDPAASPQLLHYLHGKSYRKAWNFLNDVPNAKGSCGGH